MTEHITVEGGFPLKGEVRVSGAKNSAMKLVLASLLTRETIMIDNVPMISSVLGTLEIMRELGCRIKQKSHGFEISSANLSRTAVSLEKGGLYRTGSMLIGPLAARSGMASVPNPGGCRIGKRPIDRHIEALKAFGIKIKYKDGFFHASTSKLTGARIKFNKNTHTGTEAAILTAVLANGETVLENAALEPEVDDLIAFLSKMGAKITRKAGRIIVIKGVKSLHGARHTVMPDRNEAVTFAISALATRGDITVRDAIKNDLLAFLDKVREAGGEYKVLDKRTIKFFLTGKLSAVNIRTGSYPEFMTDWQAPWSLLMTQAKGISLVHERVYEDRFCYVNELLKMGAEITFYKPKINNPHKYYNFNLKKSRLKSQAIKIKGPCILHNAILNVTDLRAGATLLIASLVARGKSIIEGVEHIDRGYEKIESKLELLGARIKRKKVS